jgi:hypothetical protein
MRLLNCPKQETLFQVVTIPHEVGFWSKALVRIHTSTCPQCKASCSQMEKRWQGVFSPEPELTSSLLKVYSRLQTDETLILKGWKLGSVGTRRRGAGEWLLASGWLFRGSVAFGLTTVVTLFVWSQFGLDQRTKEVNNASTPLPYVQIRTEDTNRIKVQYVQPELLHSLEFETSNNGSDDFSEKINPGTHP